MINDYMDYYNYINNLNQMPNGNQIAYSNQASNSQMNKKSNKQNTTNNNFVEPYVGFARGNMFDNLYYEYKNYTPQELNPQNDKEYLQLLVQMYGFAAHDLALYLDVNPNDTEVIRKRAEYINMYNEALTQYENNYGPITKNNQMLDESWLWDTKKWPWEGMK